MITSELAGRTVAINAAEIQPQVTRIIKSRDFVEGTDVKQGDVLYQIDPASHEASYQSALITLAPKPPNAMPRPRPSVSRGSTRPGPPAARTMKMPCLPSGRPRRMSPWPMPISKRRASISSGPRSPRRSPGASIGPRSISEPSFTAQQTTALTTIGLAAKNAILIIEFAVEKIRHGEHLIPPAVKAARRRLRPILMTSFAFILDVLPLAIAVAPGSNAQNSIGIGVLGGTIASTMLGIFFIPLLFVTTWKIFHRRKPVQQGDIHAPATPARAE